MQNKYTSIEITHLIDILDACEKNGANVVGELVHNYIITHNIKITTRVANALLRMYLQCGLETRVLECWNEFFASSKLRPSISSYSYTLKACANAKFLEMGKLVQDHFVNSGLSHDLEIFFAVFSLYIKCGALEEADQIWQSMQENTKRFLPIHYETLINMCADAGAVDLGRQIYAAILRRGDAEINKPLEAAFKRLDKVYDVNPTTTPSEQIQS